MRYVKHSICVYGIHLCEINKKYIRNNMFVTTSDSIQNKWSTHSNRLKNSLLKLSKKWRRKKERKKNTSTNEWNEHFEIIGMHHSMDLMNKIKRTKGNKKRRCIDNRRKSEKVKQTNRNICEWHDEEIWGKMASFQFIS